MILVSTVQSVTGGVAAVAATAESRSLTFAGTWAAGKTFLVTLTNKKSGLSYQFGAGAACGIALAFARTFRDRVYGLSGSYLFYSAVELPSNWQFQDTASYILATNQSADQEALQALAVYQGRLAIFSRKTCQIWAEDPLPENFQLVQTLEATGTCAPYSVQSSGELDVYFLTDAGIRSLRVRDSSLNAFRTGIGAPVDKEVQAILRTLTDTEKAAACSCIDPSTDNYWLYIPGPSGAVGYIWVFAYHPESQVSAWSRFKPTYNVFSTYTTGTATDYTYTYTGLTVGALYRWTKATGATQLVSGTQKRTSNGYFTAGAAGTAVVTLTAKTGGSPGTLELCTRTDFVPSAFVVYGGRIYVRSGDKVFLYGGTDNNTFDNCGAQARTPLMSAQSPTASKQLQSADVAAEGEWALSVGASPEATGNGLKEVYRRSGSSFWMGQAAVNTSGTHFQMQFDENSDSYAVLSAAVVRFEGGASK